MTEHGRIGLIVFSFIIQLFIITCIDKSGALSYGNFSTYQTGTVPMDGSYCITLKGEWYSLHASNEPV